MFSQFVFVLKINNQASFSPFGPHDISVLVEETSATNPGSRWAGSLVLYFFPRNDTRVTAYNVALLVYHSCCLRQGSGGIV